ncbi:FecR family protein [Marinobacterium lutimaris]|uniref:FecR family protein n=1 Tax=Marinobacterium lutimaris TaxID=568106 RepID=A0A1H5YVT2_9GAMM|nr:FecR domain-containing protein [Marinobacterium lutimaris]SEG27587.1 FecR family protein [Marinobacterium lutimaris]
MMSPAKKLCLTLVLTTAPLLSFAEPIATIKTLSGDVTLIRDGETLSAKLGERVHEADRIITGDNGSIGLLFDDDTRVGAGPRSTLSLADFSYDANSQDGNLDVEVDNGTLSMIAGKLVENRPGAVKVRTPAAILAVRGTEFSVKVANSLDKDVAE